MYTDACERVYICVSVRECELYVVYVCICVCVSGVCSVCVCARVLLACVCESISIISKIPTEDFALDERTMRKHILIK